MPALLQITPDLFIPMGEIKFQFVRSRGPGGQNVNKVSTRVDLIFDVVSSRSISEEQRASILSALRTRLDTKGTLRLSVQESRSQMRNRELVIEKFVALLRDALRKQKKRKKTKPTISSRHERIKSKSHRGTIKKTRGRVSPDS